MPQMSRSAQLDQIIEQHNLNNHPFYQDWVSGTLPLEKLKCYAAEYGHFIGTIAEGWERIGFPQIAAEERTHEQLWGDFKSSIGAGDDLILDGTTNLVALSHDLYSSPATAIGALYAFEAQQPLTSRLKLDGLKKHYQVEEAGLRYFEVHADDESEPKILLTEAEILSDEEYLEARGACEQMAKAMWNALDSVYAWSGTPMPK